MNDPEFIARMSESAPARMVLGLWDSAKDCIERSKRSIELAESIMAKKTGHRPSANGMSCVCGYTQISYPSDKRRAVLAHVENEWRNTV